MNDERPPPSEEEWARTLVERLSVFVEIWRPYQGTELAGAQQFLNKLLEIYEADFKPGEIFEQHPVKVPAPARSSQGSLFATEAVTFTTQRMDLYLPKVCVWEMKAPAERDLSQHHAQLLGYWARTRTRYMVLCNFHEFWIYDTDQPDGQLEPRLKFSLNELPARGDALLFLRGRQPDLEHRAEKVTAQVAGQIGRIVRDLVAATGHQRSGRDQVAKFVLECVFAMYAEDTELIPPKMFTQCLKSAERTGEMHPVWSLFDDFGRKEASSRGNKFAPYVNGPLYDRNHPKIEVPPELITALYHAARDFDWQGVHPEIFGSIFEQSLNPLQRHELGAHFTRESDIQRVVKPTVVEPWRARINAMRTPKDCERVVAQMRAFHILDPACGCGNFLYVAYREMKRLESALVAQWIHLQRNAAKRRKDLVPPPPRPYFSLKQLHGIEVDSFAAFLARVVLWIGEHLARRELGLDEEVLPLKNLDANVRHGDALFTPWVRPEGELAIIGNPPYLGVRKLRAELGDEYVEKLFAAHPHNRAADLVTYWFPHALDTLREGERAGFVCTNSIAQNESREASLDRVVAKGATLTEAWRSFPWPGEAAVHVAIVNWVMRADDGVKRLDGAVVDRISPALTDTADVTSAGVIEANRGLCFMGVTPGNHGFVLDAAQRDEILASDPGSEVVIRPFLVGRDVNREVDQSATRWVIDFASMDRDEAAVFRGAFRHVQEHVYDAKQGDSDRKTEQEKARWWQFVRPRPELRAALDGRKHALVIPRVSPHLIVSRSSTKVCFDGALQVVALSHRYHFGVLQSRLHEIWARARGSTLEERLRYTNSTVFETFPFPRDADGAYDPRAVPVGERYERVTAAAKAFEAARAAECTRQKLGLTKIHNALAAGSADPVLTAAWVELNDAVTAAYGFAKGTWRDQGETLTRLLKLNKRLTRTDNAAE